MAKIYGLFGAMTGKTADVVMAVRNGEQIIRKYQPIVANPSTPAQVEARAKLKLLSQLSAVLAPAIAIRRKGSASPRNVFTKKNYGLTSYASNEANITLAQVQLTDSVVALPIIGATRSGGTLNLSVDYADPEIDRVVYAVVIKETNERLRYFSSIVVSKETAANFAAAIEVSDGFPIVAYAYGVRLNSDNARAIFANLTAPTAETVAKIVVSRSLTESDITLTETRGIEIAAVGE